MRHRVDLMEYDGNGACGCEDFEFRVRPVLEEGAAPGVTLECRHIHLARHYSAVELWMTFAKRRKELEKARRAERKRHADHYEVEAEVPERTEEEGAMDKPPGGKRVYYLTG